MENFGLYLVMTSPVVGYEKLTEIAVEEKVKMLQLREKKASAKEILKIAEKIRKITEGTDTKFIINDRPDIAMIVDADGIHLGQTDIDISSVKKIWKKNKIYGKSTHNFFQAENAMNETPDYIGFGPIWPTKSKKIPDPITGKDKAGEIIKKIALPVVAIGGIKDYNLRELLELGIRNYAVVTYITLSENPRKQIRTLREIERSYYDSIRSS